MPEVTWLVVGALLGLFVLVTSLRVVPEHSRLVVSRLGRVTRVAGPGVVLRVPGLDHLAEVSLHPVRLDVVTAAATEDGVPVRVHAEALVQVTHPALSAWRADAADPSSAAATEVESALVREVAHHRLADLLAQRSRLEQVAAIEASSVAKAWGVEVQQVTVVDLEARLTAQLVDGLGARPVREPGAAALTTEPP